MGVDSREQGQLEMWCQQLCQGEFEDMSDFAKYTTQGLMKWGQKCLTKCQIGSACFEDMSNPKL